MAKPIKPIGNPGSWALDAVAGSTRYVHDAAAEIGSAHAAPPEVSDIGIDDLKAALRKGREDFTAMRTDVMFVVLLYPVIGICMAAFAFNENFVPMLFPLMAGFALLGPVAAVGLYEMSRRRERGEPAGFGAALGVLGSPALGAILTFGLYLAVIFIAWMLTAYLIYNVTLGPEPPASPGSLLTDTFTTGAGWAMLIIGCGVGFLFALATLAISIVSIPLLLHRHVGVPVAIATSMALMKRNPVPVLTWGLIVAVLLAVGTIPLFLGLIFVLPILGHATWHLYRRAVK